MTKVLRILNRFNLGGPTFNVAYLTKYMEPEFHTVLAGGSIDDTEGSSRFILDNLNIKPELIPEMKREVNFADDIRAYFRVKKLIREVKPEIVHTHASKAGALGRMAAYHSKVPIIVHTFHGHVFHSYFGKIKTRMVLETERYLAKRTTAIVAISEMQKYELSHEFKICPENKIHVVPLGFDLSRFNENKDEKRKKFRAKYHIPENTVVVSIVGRLVPIKNHKMFIDSIVEAKKQYPGEMRAMIVGDGELRVELEEYCNKITNENGMSSDLFQFTSWIAEIDEVNAGSDIIALSSFNEGTPVSLIEAQASGKPIVTTLVGGIENIVLEGKTALLSPSDNRKQFTFNLVKLLNNKTMREQMSADGWPFVKEKFHYTRLVNDMKILYKELLISNKSH